MKKAALLGILSVVVVEAGCMMGPNYKRPTVSVPTGYRSAMPDQPAAAASLGNEEWWDVYQDPVLADLIHTALQQNYDVRIAATRVLEAQAQLGITRANQLPSASVGASIYSQQKREDFKPVPPLPSQRGSTEPIRDLESRLLGKIPAADRSRSGPDARKRVGAAGGDFVSRCKRGDGPISSFGRSTANLRSLRTPWDHGNNLSN